MDSIQALEDLKETVAWRMIVEKIEDNIVENHRLLEDAESFDEVSKIQGQIRGLKFCLELPEILIDELTYQRDHAGLEDTNE